MTDMGAIGKPSEKYFAISTMHFSDFAFLDVFKNQLTDYMLTGSKYLKTYR